MTAGELQRIAVRLSNQSWCRHWLNFYNNHDNVKMAIQVKDWDGKCEPIPDLTKLGFEELPDFIYVINRTNEDGSPFISQLF